MRFHTTFFIVSVIAALSGVVWAAGQPLSDISGSWSLSVDGGTHGEPTLAVRQQGQSLTGTITNARGTQKITGTIKGNRAVFGFVATRDGATVKAAYEGTHESATKMSGRVEFTGSMTGTGRWVGTKK
jgi:hypothetical protein